jgi:hypothetical protein
MALHMEDKNRQAGQDLDRIFMQRKQREQETAQVGSRAQGIAAHMRTSGLCCVMQLPV